MTIHSIGNMRHYFLQDFCNGTTATTTQTQTDTDMTSWISRSCSKLQQCFNNVTSPRTDKNNNRSVSFRDERTSTSSTTTITNTNGTFTDVFYEVTEQDLPGYENSTRKGKVVKVRSVSSSVEYTLSDKISADKTAENLTCCRKF